MSSDAMTRPRWSVVAALGSAETLAWGSSYYLPATLADPIAAEPRPKADRDEIKKEKGLLVTGEVVHVSEEGR